MSELQHWVWLSERLAVRPKRKLELLEAFGDVRQVYFALEEDYRAMVPGLTPSELRVRSERTPPIILMPDVAVALQENTEQLGTYLVQILTYYFKSDIR